jgi:hypothetical protein
MMPAVKEILTDILIPARGGPASLPICNREWTRMDANISVFIGVH